jgi:hypothetical protein
MAKRNDQSAAAKLPLAQMMPDPANPRKMKPAAREGLGVSMETFGPLDIVFNVRTREFVSGHQRVERPKTAGATEVVREGNWGYILHPKTGEKFPVRFVDWDKTKQRMANLEANNPEVQGEFTDSVVGELQDVSNQIEFAPLLLDNLLTSLQDGKLIIRERHGLDHFELAPAPVKAWVLIATTSDRLPEIEAAVRPFEDSETRIEVSNGRDG